MHAFAAYFVRSQQKTVKTDTKRIPWLPCDNTKTAKKSFRGRMRHRSLLETRLETAPGRSGSIWGPAQGRFWTVPGRSWHARGVPRSLLRRLLGNPDPSQARPGASPNSFECPKLPPIEFLSIFGRSLVRLHVVSFMRSIVLLIAPSFARSTFQSHDPSV